ncbi:S-adenosyl-l-methionine hydroxide adenosyltransferase family protein [Lapidilactobacillus achengensis]|uniref:S-adenosyl-l-methionine hydroxide adenosyltransferase family protein n=1 Tax=Lapidilactobacillus achengensis TaxID=2486000 RepID=A0ABW1UMG6_9LACO|nr:S-adenosyl-l-methionine hydroxide adenosyltransferase family protein [Lapidilactobacillus achengensis]
MANFLVIQTDFGLQDGAVSAMYGVAYQVEPSLVINDLTHEIEPYNIHDASYRLWQTASYWPAGTVFVSVVDPGVGSTRRSVVAELADGQYIITPDNGTLTYLAKYVGIKAVRQIDQATQRLAGSSASHTFHGRDVYVYNGARLACGKVDFAELGPELPVAELVTFPLEAPQQTETTIRGTIDITDVRFGSLWTNIPADFFKKWAVAYGESLSVSIYYQGVVRYHDQVIFGRSFAQVPAESAVLYINSLLNVGLGINLGSFATTYQIGTGNDWTIELTRSPK